MQKLFLNSTFALLISVLLFGVSTVHAKTQFSSRYFDTTIDCNCNEKDLQEGQDCIQFTCKEMAGYQIQVSYDGSACDLGKLKILKNSNIIVALSEVPTKLEWRFADSQPFAVIYRVKGQAKNCIEQNIGVRSKVLLVVTGLDKQKSISGQIDAKLPNANIKARDLADLGFKSKPKL